VARCPACGLITPSGSNCFVEDSTCWEWSGTGTAGDPYLLLPVLSVDSDQLLQCTDDGLFGEPPEELSDPPACQAYSTVNLTIANSSMTALALNNKIYDTDTMHSNTTNNTRITFTTAGTYLVTFVCAWNKHATGDRIAQIRKNGTDVLAYESKRTGGSDLIVGHSVTVEDAFIATDYVEAMVQQTSGGNLLVLAESYSPFFSAAKVA
jgi:hypothetical protein